MRILTEPKNALVKQYQKLFGFDDVRLTFEHEAVNAIAALAVERKTGARGLRNVMEQIMLDIMYEIPSKNLKEFTVTLDLAKEKLENADFMRHAMAS